jgi:hypothetical protein
MIDCISAERSKQQFFAEHLPELRGLVGINAGKVQVTCICHNPDAPDPSPHFMSALAIERQVKSA